MSRARQNSTGRLRLAPAAVVGIALALAGCSAGQISQTAGMEPAVNGGIGQAGPIAVRNVQLAYSDDGVYPKGSSAALLGSIVNTGQNDDELVSVSSPAGTVTITGDRRLPPGRTLVAEPGPATDVTVTTTPSPTTTGTSTTTTTGSSQPPSGSGTVTVATTSPSAPTTTPKPTATTPVSVGKVTVVIKNLAEEIRSGKTIDVTFIFRSGQTTVTVPVAVPTTPRQPPAIESP